MATQKELDHIYRMRKVQLWQDAIKRLSIVFCVFIFCGAVYLSFRTLAGRQTFADIAFRFAADMKADKPIAIMLSSALTLITGSWGFSERWARRRYIEKYHPIIKQYQESLDARRGTSGLTAKGTTKSEDI